MSSGLSKQAKAFCRYSMCSKTPPAMSRSNASARYLAGTAIRIDFLVLVKVELQAMLELPVCVAKRTLPGTREFFGGVDNLNRALLELHSVATGGDRNTDQPLGEIDIAVMVNSDFGDYIAGLGISGELIPYLNPFQLHRNTVRIHGDNSHESDSYSTHRQRRARTSEGVPSQGSADAFIEGNSRTEAQFFLGTQGGRNVV